MAGAADIPVGLAIHPPPLGGQIVTGGPDKPRRRRLVEQMRKQPAQRFAADISDHAGNYFRHRSSHPSLPGRPCRSTLLRPAQGVAGGRYARTCCTGGNAENMPNIIAFHALQLDNRQRRPLFRGQPVDRREHRLQLERGFRPWPPDPQALCASRHAQRTINITTVDIPQQRATQAPRPCQHCAPVQATFECYPDKIVGRAESPVSAAA